MFSDENIKIQCNSIGSKLKLAKLSFKCVLCTLNTSIINVLYYFPAPAPQQFVQVVQEQVLKSTGSLYDSEHKFQLYIPKSNKCMNIIFKGHGYSYAAPPPVHVEEKIVQLIQHHHGYAAPPPAPIKIVKIIQEEGHGYSAPQPQLVKVIVQRSQGGHGHGHGHGHGGYSGPAPVKIVKVYKRACNQKL